MRPATSPGPTRSGVVFAQLPLLAAQLLGSFPEGAIETKPRILVLCLGADHRQPAHLKVDAAAVFIPLFVEMRRGGCQPAKIFARHFQDCLLRVGAKRVAEIDIAAFDRDWGFDALKFHAQAPGWLAYNDPSRHLLQVRPVQNAIADRSETHNALRRTPLLPPVRTLDRDRGQ